MNDERTYTPEEAIIDRDQIASVANIISNERRTHLITLLERQGAPVSLSDAARMIASIEEDKPIRQLNSQEYKRVYVGLYQTHIPQMEDEGIVVTERSDIYPGEYFQAAWYAITAIGSAIRDGRE